MTTGAIIVLNIFIFAVCAFAWYASNHVEDDDQHNHKKSKHA